jgi:hypothetical protein
MAKVGLQVTKDPASGEVRTMTTAKSTSDVETLAILIDRLKTLRDKIQSGDISEKDKDFFRGVCEVNWPHDPTEAVRDLNDVIKEKRRELSDLKKI